MFRPSKQSFVQVGEEYRLAITEMSRKGDGIARIDGKIIFVPGTGIGDVVKLRIVNVRTTYAEAVKVD